jgi:regulatory protein
MIKQRRSPKPGQEQRVTKVSFQAHDQSRVNIHLDGAYAFALSAVEAVNLGVKVGRVLTADELATIQSLEEVERARANALLLLSSRPRSRRELTERLKRKGYPLELVDRVIDDLQAKGYVDDAAFARYWVENRQANQPRGRQALVAELRAKGVATDLIGEVVAPVGDQEEETALVLARRRVRSLAGLDDARFRQRLTAFLQRKGYAYETVRVVVQTLLRERSAGGDTDRTANDADAEDGELP